MTSESSASIGLEKECWYCCYADFHLLDSDLAILYQVETKTFNLAVKRNIERFPENFRFQLKKEEVEEDICHMFLLSKALQCCLLY